MAREFFLVDLQEARNHRLARIRIEPWKAGGEHRACTFGHVRTQRIQCDHGFATLDQHAVERRDEVRRTVEQRAVEIEQDQRGKTQARGLRSTQA